MFPEPPSRSVRARLSLLLALASLAVTGCGTTSPIINHWVHSHEEDVDESIVYRPSTFDFPPSRGREHWELRTGGTAIRHAIAPADGSIRHEGTWSLSSDSLLTIDLASGSPMHHAFRVVAVDTARLVLRRAR